MVRRIFPEQPLDNGQLSMVYRGVNLSDFCDALDQVVEAFNNEAVRIPLMGLTLVDTETILDPLEEIRDNIPSVIDQALDVIETQQARLQQAQQEAAEIVATAKQQASEILDRHTIVTKAQAKAKQLEYQAKQDYEIKRQQADHEIAQRQRRAYQEIEQQQQQAQQEAAAMKQRARQEAEMVIQDAAAREEEAWEYVQGMMAGLDKTLSNINANMEQQLEAINRGRQQIPPPGQKRLLPRKER